MTMLYYWYLLYLTEKVFGLITVFSPSGRRFSRRGTVQTMQARVVTLPGGKHPPPCREDGLVLSP